MTQTAEIGRAVRNLARIRSKPGQAAQLRQALEILEAATAKEPGCREFRFYQALSAPEEFVLMEEFADAAALEEHMHLPHTRAFFQAGLTDSIRAQDL